MKKIFLIIPIILLLSGCIILPFCYSDNGPIITDYLDLETINAIVNTGSFDVYVRYGNEQKIKVVGNERVVNSLNHNVYDGKWIINLGSGSFCNFDLTIYITIPYLNKIELNGSGNIYIEQFSDSNTIEIINYGSGNIHFDNLTYKNIIIENNGSGDIKGNIDCIYLKSSLLGSGNIKISGISDNQKTTIDGSGSYRCIDLKSFYADIFNEGSGNAYVYVSDFMKVTISGSGNVYYKGNPTIDLKIFGSGRLFKY